MTVFDEPLRRRNGAWQTHALVMAGRSPPHAEQVTLLGTPDARDAYRRLTWLDGEPPSGGGLADCVVDCVNNRIHRWLCATTPDDDDPPLDLWDRAVTVPPERRRDPAANGRRLPVSRVHCAFLANRAIASRIASCIAGLPVWPESPITFNSASGHALASSHAVFSGEPRSSRPWISTAGIPASRSASRNSCP